MQSERIKQSLLLLRRAKDEQSLKAWELVTLYILLELQERHGPQWLGSRASNTCHATANSISIAQTVNYNLELTPRLLERLNGCGDLYELLSQFQLRGVREDSRAGLLGWAEGRFDLLLWNTIPSPKEMLDTQCLGKRIVTLRLQECEQNESIGRHVNALAFTLHDLEHANKFFTDPESHRGQVRFFNLLRLALEHRVFDLLMSDDRFVFALNYLLSDMNSHPVHLFKYLKAIVLDGCQRLNRSERYHSLVDELLTLWNFPPEVIGAAKNINEPDQESEADRIVLFEHLRSQGVLSL